MGFAIRAKWAAPQAKASATRPASTSRRPASFIGNQAALRRLSAAPLKVQPKLEIGAVNHPLEREADAVADAVMRMPDSAIALSAAPRQVSRKCTKCEEEDKKKLETKPAGAKQAAATEALLIARQARRQPANHRFRCEANSSCEKDEQISKRDPSGEADCNESTGKVDPIVSKEQCAGDCILQHESTHAADENACCQVFANCLKSASTLDERNKCRSNWDDFIQENEAWTECNAYNVEGQCLTKVINQNCKSSGGPVSNDCCASLQSELDTVSQRAALYCSQTRGVALPCGLFFR
jgi:hypothetical protein